jgi:hypothetical protein
MPLKKKFFFIAIGSYDRYTAIGAQRQIKKRLSAAIAYDAILPMKKNFFKFLFFNFL